jgi:DUF4097 and DUF4098 domain-containing protein YvlB
MTTTTDHRGSRVFFVLLGAPLVAVFILVGAFAITGTLARQTESAPLAFADTIERIQIDLSNGSVTLRGGEVAQVAGERVVTRGLQNPAFSERVEGRTLYIESTCFPIGNTWCDVSYVLDIPSSVDVSVDTALGSIRVSDLDGTADLSSATGSIVVEDASGPLRLDSGAGSIEGTRLTSSTVLASTGAGSVALTFAAPPQLVDADAGAGSVDVELPRDGTTYRVDQVPSDTNIRVAVSTDPSSNRVLRLQSGAGSVSVHYPEA